MRPVDEWQHYQNGMLTIAPLLDGGAVVVTSGDIVLRLEYAENPVEGMAVQMGQSSPLALQLGLTADQARRMIDVLEKKLQSLAAGSATRN